MTAALLDAEELVARWRDGIDLDSPAGPIFATGEFAEGDIVASGVGITRVGCSACTASGTRRCC